MDVVYRLFNADDRLLYVGVTNKIGYRLTQHSRDKAWWQDVQRITVERHADRHSALLAETEAIRTERPMHNIANGGTRYPIKWTTTVPEAERDWMTAAEFAAMFRVSEIYVQRLVRNGTLTVTGDTGTARIPRSEALRRLNAAA